METYLRVLSDADRDRVHESTIKILSETGVKVETDLGRPYLKEAGAGVDENTKIVRIPRKLLEDSYSRTQDAEESTRELTDLIMKRAPDYFLPKEVMAMVIGQMMKYIAKSQAGA